MLAEAASIVADLSKYILYDFSICILFGSGSTEATSRKLKHVRFINVYYLLLILSYLTIRKALSKVSSILEMER